MLDLVEVALKINGFKFQRVDGSRTDEQRQRSLKTFRTDDQYSILLASIGSAGVGYYITCLSYPSPCLSKHLHRLMLLGWI